MLVSIVVKQRFDDGVRGTNFSRALGSGKSPTKVGTLNSLVHSPSICFKAACAAAASAALMVAPSPRAAPPFHFNST